MTTKGEYRVGIDFNPSAGDLVTRIKRAAADLVDLVGTIGLDQPTDLVGRNGEVERLKALAQTEIESAAMWAVKAATKPEMPLAFTAPAEAGGPDLFTEIVRAAIKGLSADASHPACMMAATEELRRAGFVAVSDTELAGTIIDIRDGKA